MNLTRHGRNCLCVSKFLSSSQDRNLIIYYIKQSTYSSYDDLFNWYSSWWGYHLVCTYTCVICMNIRYIYIYAHKYVCIHGFSPNNAYFILFALPHNDSQITIAGSANLTSFLFNLWWVWPLIQKAKIVGQVYTLIICLDVLPYHRKPQLPQVLLYVPLARLISITMRAENEDKPHVFCDV